MKHGEPTLASLLAAEQTLATLNKHLADECQKHWATWPKAWIIKHAKARQTLIDARAVILDLVDESYPPTPTQSDNNVQADTEGGLRVNDGLDREGENSPPQYVVDAWKKLCGCCPVCSTTPCEGAMGGGVCDDITCNCYTYGFESECYMGADGQCAGAGTEHCDWDCPDGGC